MISKKVSQLVETSSASWKPSKVPGVEYVALHTDPKEKEGTFLLKMAPGTSYPRHRHPGGEEILMLKGDMIVGDRKMKPGDFLYSPPSSVHDASTEKGCMFMTILPKAVEFVAASGTDDREISQTEIQATGTEITEHGLIDLPTDTDVPG